MLKYLLFLAIAISVSPLRVAAQPADPCVTQSSTMEINACAKHQFDAQDRLLNQAYQAVIKNMAAENSTGVSGESPRKLLIRSQRKWVEFRDADCLAMQKVFQNGSIRNAVYLDCLKTRTKQRIKELQPQDWQGG